MNTNFSKLLIAFNEKLCVPSTITEITAQETVGNLEMKYTQIIKLDSFSFHLFFRLGIAPMGFWSSPGKMAGCIILFGWITNYRDTIQSTPHLDPTFYSLLHTLP